MVLKNLRLRNWRNLDQADVALCGRTSVFSGGNGQGKSNFLEAAHFAVVFRSFRSSLGAELIGWGAESAAIEAEIELHGVSRTLRVDLGVGKKSTRLDGKSVRRDAEALAGAAVIFFGPEDLRLVKAAAADRRRALDRCVFAVHRPYFREAVEFERALKGRNSLLRQGGYRAELLESYDEALARAGARVVVRRRETAAGLLPRFVEAFAEIHGGEAGICYRSDDRVEGAKTEKEVEEALQRGLRESRASDERRGFSGFGPQTDDLEISLGDRPARSHGSQGQMRLLVLALKIAELRLVEERNREMPVLLLDDVASELDEERRSRLFEKISAMACQTLITVTEREHVPGLPGREDFLVKRGRIEAI